MSFLDKLFAGGGAPATELKTPSGSIRVDGADPVPGYVLTVIDAAHAQWLASTGGGGGSAFASHVVSASAITAETSSRYVISTPDTAFVLPDGTLPANAGKSIDVTFAEDGGSAIVTRSAPALNYFLIDGVVSVDEPVRLGPWGTYTFLCVYDQAVYPVAFWVLIRHPGAFGRRSVDVDYAPGAPLPSGWTFTPIGSGTRFLLNSTPGHGDLPKDRDALSSFFTYPVGTTLLIAFDGVTSGVFRVNRHNSADDWELELIERANGSGAPIGEGSSTEYVVRRGSMFGGRRFLMQGAPNPYALEPRPLRMYPRPGRDHSFDAVLPGEEFFTNFDNGYGGGELMIGCVNRLDVTGAGTHTYRLAWPSKTYDRLDGERFAVTTALGLGVAVDIYPGYDFVSLANAPDGSLAGPGSPTSLVMNPGTYAEWQLDATLMVWRLVAYIAGSPSA